MGWTVTRGMGASVLALGLLVGCGDKGDDGDDDDWTDDDGADAADGSDGSDGSDGGGDGTGDDGGDADADGDGYTVADGDCDDDDASVNPAATETWYDGVDQDCDGASDYDADRDGYDSDAHGGADCDDTDPAFAPGAAEVWDDGLDQDCDGAADRQGSTCTTDLTLTLGDGSEVPLDFCAGPWTLDLGLDYEPDETPRVTRFTLAMDGVGDAAFTCTLDLDQPDTCGVGYYRLGPDERGQLELVTLHCVGVPEADEGAFSGAGYLRIDAFDTGSDFGDRSGEPTAHGLSAWIAITADHLQLEGSVSVGGTKLAGAGEAAGDCAQADADEDDDGAISAAFDGDDCDDADPELNRLDADSDGVDTCDGDCVDTEASINPNAAEVCGDGIDQNCDRSLADGCGAVGAHDLTDANVTLVGLEPGDESGWSVAAGDVDGDGVDDLYVGAPGYDAGAGFLLLGPLTADGDLGAAEAIIEGANPEGPNSFAVEDVDGDGYADLISGRPTSGAASIHYGPVSGTTTLNAGDWLLESGPAKLGHAVSAGGDLNGNGVRDLVLGAPLSNGNYDEGGEVVIFYDAPTGVVSDEDADVTLFEGGPYSYFGMSVAILGDTDGDGLDDLAVGASGASALHIVLGPGTSTGIQLDGDGELGITASAAGDVNGDGYADVIAGGHRMGNNDEGAAWLFYGPFSAGDGGAVEGGGTATASGTAVFEGALRSARAGEAVSGLGDMNGDSTDDIGIGAWRGDAVYVFYGPLTGTYDTTDGDAVLTGSGDESGRSLAGNADLNDDGFGDLIIGATGWDDAGGEEGATFLIFGGPGQ